MEANQFLLWNSWNTNFGLWWSELFTFSVSFIVKVFKKRELVVNAFLSFTVGYFSDIWTTGVQFLKEYFKTFTDFKRFWLHLLKPISTAGFLAFKWKGERRETLTGKEQIFKLYFPLNLYFNSSSSGQRLSFLICLQCTCKQLSPVLDGVSRFCYKANNESYLV